MKKLVIVESPTKAKTISKFLGKEYLIESSYGHVRDLPKSKLGIDVENNFQPSYIIPTKAKKRVSELKKLAEKSDEVILASDEDREGEAIAWHIAQILDKKSDKIKRIVFHEITKSAIDAAVKNPRDIDLNLVNAQQARRVLDRLVGYELSPFLWKKVFRGLSAGRVQSVALRLIADREKEIQAFNPQEYWSVIARLNPENKKDQPFDAKLHKQDEKTLDKLAIKNKTEADKISKELESAEYKVARTENKEMKRMPYAPFTTSTLQQEASAKLRFSAKQTMMTAQRLYENGFISYMRTDSLNLSEESLKATKEFIINSFGKDYSLDQPRRFKTKSKGAQEAHEAIRPTDPGKDSSNVKNKLDDQQYKLYDLIWRRFIACQMPPAVFDSTTVDIAANNFVFRASGSIIKFDGWLRVYPAKFSENLLPKMSEGEILDLVKLSSDQHFTEPPPRYSEATLVKALEENGIGRPSTYAPIITTIQTRNYAIKNEQRKFVPTETGILVNDIIVKHFPDIVDIKFTAKMEENLDKIAEGKEEWVPVINNFYQPFHKNLMQKHDEVEKQNIDEKTNEVCEKCGKPMLIKRGRFGKFLACSGFPECKTTKAIKEPPKTIGMKCPKCEEGLAAGTLTEAGEVIIQHTKKKRMFYGCSRYPKCDFASWKNPLENKPH